MSWEAINYVKPLAPTVASLAPTRSSTEWEGEWVRTLSVADPKVVMGSTPSGAFRPGSLQGVWEGLFTVRRSCAYALSWSGLLTAKSTCFSTQSSQRMPHYSQAHHLPRSNVPSSHNTDRHGNSANITFSKTTPHLHHACARFLLGTLRGGISRTAPQSAKSLTDLK